MVRKLLHIGNFAMFTRCAFDSANQPDRQLLIRDKVNKKLNGSEPVVFEAMKRAYYMAFVAAEKLERTELCCSPIGNVAFKPPEFTQEEFEEKFVWPAGRSRPRQTPAR